MKILIFKSKITMAYISHKEILNINKINCTVSKCINCLFWDLHTFKSTDNGMRVIIVLKNYETIRF